ncbi:MAG TPA: hypothetical protein VJN69_11540 [Candidatus Acidoferrales bacterium]|nr:hypothetical protein [Candidatus Acidoferrales bacterium]
MLLELAFTAIFKSRIRRVLESLNLLSTEVALVCELLRIVETGQFSSPKLASFSAMLKSGGVPASELSGKLYRLLRLLYERDNDFFAPISWCLLWGSQFSMAIDRWRRRYGDEMLKWLAVLGEFEALISVGTYANEHPEDAMPEIVSAGQPLFEAEELGHPLLARDVCVRNDIHLTENARFVVISGSNMSGKSTFLRAIGVNAVLAWMGAPVCCKSLRISELFVGTSIRVADSLLDGRSHFFAEMQRLRRMIDCADQGPLLFLADEIMSGTNSHDRRIAAEWVIRALVARNAIGLITTHDLALTEIASSGLPGKNAYFEDTGEAGHLIFDYKLRPGILTHSNALNIAHALGIDTTALQSK